MYHVRCMAYYKACPVYAVYGIHGKSTRGPREGQGKVSLCAKGRARKGLWQGLWHLWQGLWQGEWRGLCRGAWQGECQVPCAALACVIITYSPYARRPWERKAEHMGGVRPCAALRPWVSTEGSKGRGGVRDHGGGGDDARRLQVGLPVARV